MARKLKTDVPRLRRILADGVEFDPAAVQELSCISGSLRDSAASAGGMRIAQIANQLLVTLQQMAMPSHHASLVEELALRYLFVKLKSAARQVR